MALNSHFKRFILPALFASPAWVWLLDAVLCVISDGGSFLSRFKLFLGFDRQTGEPITTLPAPVGEWGFNPVYVDFQAVKDLLDTQGFALDFKSSLEMLPTGLGRLNCTSPYMFFKVLNALKVPRSRFSFLTQSFLPAPSSRVIDNFLWLTGDLGNGIYTYKTLSPLRDGDSVLFEETEITILSYSTEMVELGQEVSLGLYTIMRTDALFPLMPEGQQLRLWTYPEVPSQLVYDRYSPIHLFGTSLQQLVLSAFTVRCTLEAFELEQLMWVVWKDALDNAYNTVGYLQVTEALLASLQVPSTAFSFGMDDWAALGYTSGVAWEQIVLTKWASLPTQSFSENAYLFDIKGFDYLFPDPYTVVLDTETDPAYPNSPLIIATDDATPKGLTIDLMAQLIRDTDFDIFTLFDATLPYSFGFSTTSNTMFEWTPISEVGGLITGTATFGTVSLGLAIPSATSLRLQLTNNVVSVWVDGVLTLTVTLQPSDLFMGFSPGMVYYFRYFNNVATASADGVTYGGTLMPDIASVESGFPFVSLIASDYVRPASSVVCGTQYTLSVFNYSVPFAVSETFTTIWDVDMTLSWDVDLSVAFDEL